MTRKERILAAINCRAIDRVPYATYNIHPYSDNTHTRDESYSEILERIRNFAGTAAKSHAPGVGVAMSRASDERVEHVSEVRDGATLTTTIIHTPRGDLSSVTTSYPGKPGMLTKHLIASDEDINKYMSIPYEPPVFDPTAAKAMCEAVGDRGMVFFGFQETTESVVPLFHYEDFCMRTITDLPGLERLFDWASERCLENVKLLVEVCAGMDVVFHAIGPEYCTPPMIAPSVFAKLVTPHMRRSIDVIHAAGFPVSIHCHGKVREVFEEMIKTGADMLEPIEPIPQGDIDLAELMELSAGRMSLMGHVQDQDFYTAPEGHFTNWVEQIARVVDGRTGYIMSPTCTPFDIPCTDTYKRNYIEWLDAAERLL